MPSKQHQEIEAVRAAALALHKRLLDEARADYEREHGAMSANQMLGLVAYGPQFQWLRPLSRLIVDLDIRLEQKELTDADVKAALAEVAKLGETDARLSEMPAA